MIGQKLACFLLLQFALQPAVVKTRAKQVPANRKIFAAAATAIRTQLNQPSTESDQNSVEPKRSPSEVMTLVAVTVATILNAVHFDGASKFLFFVDWRGIEVGQRSYRAVKFKVGSQLVRSNVFSSWR